MTDPRTPRATDVACNSLPGFRMSWTLPVLAIVMSALTTGCGTASSDEYEAVDVSQTTPKATVTPASAATLPPETVDEGTPAGSAKPVASNPGAKPQQPAPDQIASQEHNASSRPETVKPESVVSVDGSDSPGAVSPENSETVTGGPAKPEAGTEIPVVEPREVKLLVPERTFQATGREQALRVTFDDVDLLKVLNMEPVLAEAPQLMPGWLKGLEGKRIRLRGFMYPTFQDTGIEVFLLARDNDICCFGRSPKVYDIIKVSMKEGETTDYIQGRPFDVIGVFHIADKAEVAEDALPKLYSLTDAVVISR